MADDAKRKDLSMDNEGLFRLFVEESRDMIYRMSLSEGKYEYVSPASVYITGFTPEEFYTSPMMIREMIHPDWREYLEKEWNNLIAGNMPETYEYQIIDKSGSTKWIHQRNVLIRDEEGRPLAIDGILTDVTKLKNAEELLHKAYDEKKELLRELQHRAKNSFNMLYSMVQLSADSGVGRETESMLNEISAKIKAVAEMYDLLYQSDALSDVSLDTYLGKVLGSMPRFSSNIIINRFFDGVTLSTKSAIPVGIITAELITNSIKHAFPDREKGTVTISLKKTGAEAALVVRDDGKGFPEDLNLQTAKSLGLKMVNTLTRQIGGSFEMKNENGTVCLLKFPLDK